MELSVGLVFYLRSIGRCPPHNPLTINSTPTPQLFSLIPFHFINKREFVCWVEWDWLSGRKIEFVWCGGSSSSLAGCLRLAAALNPPIHQLNSPLLFFLFAFVSFLQQKREREMKRQAALASWLACLFFCGARLQQQPLTHKKRKAKKPSQPSRFRRIRRSNLSFISSPIRKSELKWKNRLADGVRPVSTSPN